MSKPRRRTHFEVVSDRLDGAARRFARARGAKLEKERARLRGAAIAYARMLNLDAGEEGAGAEIDETLGGGKSN